MVYTVAFLKDGGVIDRVVFTAAGYPEFHRELARVRSDFRSRRPGFKEIMSVTSGPDEDRPTSRVKPRSKPLGRPRRALLR
jgi:hypothetical protein